MNVIIPMAGLGSRFFTEQYKLPKPLIDIRGKPMIQRAIETLDLDGQYYFLLRKSEWTDLMVSVIQSVVPSAKFKVIDYLTEGPACSTLLFEQDINADDELVVANCDQILSWNSKMFLHNVRMFDGAVVTYHSDTEKNSFAKLDKQGYVTEIREKEVISSVSLNGIHYWRNTYRFFASAKEMILANDRAENGEFYIGPTYNYMIKHNYKVGIYHIPNEQHHPVGVPADLERYLNYHDSRQD
jgi:NDP-sugar pyrophosphorylase family protein